MVSLAEFVRELVVEGRVEVQGRPETDLSHRAEAVAILESAFGDHRLDVAGPPIGFDAEVALRSAELVRQACWFLVNRDEPAEALARGLVIPPAPRSASDHLSSDLTFRFLPRIDRRARALNPGDRLSKILADAFRRFPLSGVLSDLNPGPGEVGGLGGHAGLGLLYAERLAGAVRPGWMPEAGSVAAEAVEWLAGRASSRPAKGVAR